MGNNLAKSSKGHAVSTLPALSSTLADAVKSDVEWYEPPAQFKGFLGDGSENWHQPPGEWRETAWKAPANLTNLDRVEAGRALDAMAPMLEPAKIGPIKAWVLDLGTIKKKTSEVATSLTEVVFNIADQLERDGFPLACFTPESVSEVAREIEWFGDYGDIAKALEPIRARVAREAARLRAIAEGGAPKRKAKPYAKPCRGKEFYAMMRGLYEANGMDYPGDAKATLTDIAGLDPKGGNDGAKA